ncbi:glycosyltransferase [Allochromatium palmeri]|uniref:Glycosyltransferase n=1 Tax=Allochromatium palmeri TaxID=231048 RepID=A0A6N8EEX3_9GAMM|nr:glycosyltransferase [Allochromatium palmeri]MTW22773.1 glycosyltransferase [Allochromatium palmeri]
MVQSPLKIMIGFDPIESVAIHALMHSLMAHASVPLAITPIDINHLGGIYTRPRNPKQSNAFSFTRFLTPWLSGYEGWSLFLDCDMLFRTDVAELFALADPDKAVMVVQHDYTPTTATKYLGTVQYAYPRKNWSSVMLFNNARCRVLTPDYVNTAPALDLHRFSWVDDDRIGALGVQWNHLVGELPPNAEACIVHWTIGGPYFHEYADVEFSDEWRAMYQRVIHCAQL